MKEGNLTKRGRKSNRQYYFHLFNDILLYSKSNNAQNTSFTLHRRIDLAYATINTENLENINGAFSIMSKEKSFVVFAANNAEKDAWVAELNDCIAKIFIEHTPNSDGDRRKTSGNRSFRHGKSMKQNRRVSAVEAVAQANVWVPDDSQHLCMHCGANFTLVRRRHHCRACGSLVCDACSAHRMFYQM